MRLVAGIASVVEGVVSLRDGVPIGAAILLVLGAGAGILLLAGLWTPIAGVLVAILALWQAFSHPANWWNYVMLGTLGAALALLGPGAWSADARLFGWKRVDIRDRKY
jgi:putative oxidoreductase